MTESVPRRSIRIPRLMRLVHGVQATTTALREIVEPQHSLLLVHTGARSATGYGETLAQAAIAAGMRVAVSTVDGFDQAAVARVVDAIDAHGPDFVLAAGGGRVLDVAKLACSRREIEFLSVPTQLSSDAICSPIAVIADQGGVPRSLGAQMPAAIIVDMEVVRSAPAITWRAGLGDLLSNVSAVQDWRLAHEAHGEPIDDFACITAEAAALSVIEDDASLQSEEYREKLIRGLILSGLAMEMAGSSRPASGSEHLISHALDQILAAPHLHGLQVALGTIAATILRGADHQRLVALFRRMGLPVVPADLEISIDDLLAAVRLGPSTRPGRTTILDSIGQIDLDRLRTAYLQGIG